MPCANYRRSRGATSDSKLLRGSGGIKMDFSESSDIRDSMGGPQVHGSFDEVEDEGVDAIVFMSSTEMEGLERNMLYKPIDLCI